MQHPHDPLPDLSAAPLIRELPAEVLEAVKAESRRVELAAGAELFPEGDRIESLYVVLEGLLHAVEPGAGGAQGLVRVIPTGSAVDPLQALAGAEGRVSVRAVRPTTVAEIPGDVVDRMVARFRAFDAARDRLHRRQLLCRLHAILGPMDEDFLDELETAVDWVHRSRGELLFAQGDPADGLFFVIGGRMQLVQRDRAGVERVLAEAGRGDTIGEMEFFTGAPREASARAVRDSLSVGLSNAEFEAVVARRPGVLRHVTRNVVERLANGPPRTGRVTSVAIVPLSPDAPAAELCGRLSRELERFGPVLCLDADAVDAAISEPGTARAEDDTPEAERLMAWLEAREQACRFVVYRADGAPTAWTRRALRQADRVVLVARAADDAAPGELERALTGSAERVSDARTILALVHPDGACLPKGTRKWLECRRVDEHHHLRWDRDGDVGRLARVLAGRNVALVLGGGGARGFAHVGVLKALEEAGVPVDLIGGTSMGASIAAQHALGWSPEQIHETNRRVWVILRPHRVFTLPIFSVLGSAKAEACGRMMYGEVEIEDLWIPFYCVSSDLTAAEMMVHRSGSLLWAATASASLPGVAVPVLANGHLLVDGALLNNLPTDVARGIGAGTVIASEVSVEEDQRFTCDRVPSPWEAVRGRALFRPPVPFPSLIEVAMRASMLHSVYREKTALLDADLRLSPPIDRFSLMDFDSLDEIIQTGYEYARGAVAAYLANEAASAHAAAAPTPGPAPTGGEGGGGDHIAREAGFAAL